VKPFTQVRQVEGEFEQVAQGDAQATQVTTWVIVGEEDEEVLDVLEVEEFVGACDVEVVFEMEAGTCPM